MGSVYPISKLFTYVMDGVKSKNARQRTGKFFNDEYTICIHVAGQLWAIRRYSYEIKVDNK